MPKQSSRLAIGIASLAVCCAPFAALAQLPLPVVAQGNARVSIVAEGLHDPRGMALGPDGDLYVAEAGTTPGIYTPPPGPPIDPATQTRDRCYTNWPLGPTNGGYTGRISKIAADGRVITVADGLPSDASNTFIGGARMGVGAVAFIGSHLYAITPGGGCSHSHPRDPNALLRVFPDGFSIPIADLGAWLSSHPDSKNPTDTDFEADGTWYSLVSARGELYTTEPNHGVMIRVGRHGGIALFANLWEMVKAIDEPDHDGDKTYSTLIKHRGTFYIGTLGRNIHDFAAFVYALSADGTTIKQIASGLHGVLGIAFDKRERLYALETTGPGLRLTDAAAGAGRLVRIERDGSLTPIVTNLTFPTGLLPGRRGEFYIANCGYQCDDRSHFPPDRTSLEAGQILKVVIPGAEADPD
jgi:hypothetical protein